MLYDSLARGTGSVTRAAKALSLYDDCGRLSGPLGGERSRERRGSLEAGGNRPEDIIHDRKKKYYGDDRTDLQLDTISVYGFDCLLARNNCIALIEMIAHNRCIGKITMREILCPLKRLNVDL